MPNPADIMKLMGLKKRFENNHPKFLAFISNVARKGIEEGSIIEVTLITPEGTKTTANMKVTADDVAMINDLKGMK